MQELCCWVGAFLRFLSVMMLLVGHRQIFLPYMEPKFYELFFFNLGSAISSILLIPDAWFYNVFVLRLSIAVFIIGALISFFPTHLPFMLNDRVYANLIMNLIITLSVTVVLVAHQWLHRRWPNQHSALVNRWICGLFMWLTNFFLLIYCSPLHNTKNIINTTPLLALCVGIGFINFYRWRDEFIMYGAVATPAILLLCWTENFKLYIPFYILPPILFCYFLLYLTLFITVARHLIKRMNKRSLL